MLSSAEAPMRQIQVSVAQEEFVAAVLVILAKFI